MTAPTARGGGDDEFLRAMAGTEPLAGSSMRLLGPPPPPRVLPPNDDAQALAELHALVSGAGTWDEVDSEEVHAGAASGVDARLLRKLQRGQIAWQRFIDLHGLNRQDAHDSLGHFIISARRDAKRCLLVVTGRGRGSPGGEAVLRQALPRWLMRAPIAAHVLAFCTATPADGGAGAFYVLLRRAGIAPFGTPMPP